MKKIFILTTFLIITACNSNEIQTHASGVFETDDVIISSKSMGEIVSLNINEGDNLTKDTLVGQIDNTQLQLQKKNLENAVVSAESRIVNVALQLAPIDEEVSKYKKEVERFKRLVASDAANKKQLDDVTSAYNAAIKKREATYDTLTKGNTLVLNEINGLKIQIAQVDDNIKKSLIYAPMDGVVLTKYTNAFEFAQMGKPLFKMADVSTLILRAYVTGDILTQVKVGDKAKIFADFGKDSVKEYTGEITWISEKAEFTPKTIPTRDERSNLVYAVKIKVQNDGYLRKGMYGEVIFNNIKAD